MTDPLSRNRLAEAHSPYLHQHADNPVNWQPWDDAALTAAKTHERPIFLSVGYAACHWCHVMEKESFEDTTIATLLNDHFVPIKVDREERPDVDRIYQTVCQLVTGSGGWPLSVWLTPDGRPFFVGTYFPPEPSRGMPGFAELLTRLRDSWEHDREALEERANQWVAAAKGQLEATAKSAGGHVSPDDDPLLRSAGMTAVRAADRTHGGFGEGGPKFPQPQRLELLLHAWQVTGDEAFRTVATEALDAMADRGLFDHLDGGFHRYAVDRSWQVPHFEKMLYDNAELPRVYLSGYQVTGDERYADVVRETIEFLDRELRHPAGGYYSSLDAQSEGREGAYYVWTPAQVRTAVDDEKKEALFCDRFGVTKSGNFEHGTSVLRLTQSVESLATEYDQSVAAIRSQLQEAIDACRATRREREHPRRDEKILAGWNGLVISTLAETGLILEDSDATAAAREALSFVRENHWDATEDRLSRRYLAGEVGIAGYLDDYAAVARGAIDLYQVSADPDALRFALQLASVMVDEFWEAADETFYYSPASGESLVSRPQDLADQSLPASMAMATEVLHQLHHIAPNRGYDTIVEQIISTHQERIRANPLQHASLTMVADAVATGGLEVTIAADGVAPTWRSFLAAHYLPNRFVAWRPPDETGLESWIEQLSLDSTPPIWTDRSATAGEPTAYLCRSFTCSPPLTAPEQASEWVDRLAPSEER